MGRHRRPTNPGRHRLLRIPGAHRIAGRLGVMDAIAEWFEDAVRALVLHPALLNIDISIERVERHP